MIDWLIDVCGGRKRRSVLRWFGGMDEWMGLFIPLRPATSRFWISRRGTNAKGTIDCGTKNVCGLGGGRVV